MTLFSSVGPCNVSYSCREEIGSEKAQVIVLSDQTFPPLLPTDDGRFVIVVQVGGRMLNEIGPVFSEFFQIFFSPVGTISIRSVVLIGSRSTWSPRHMLY
jgi:hypothetical protein